MITFHASASRCHDGFRPMVLIRNPKGQMIGSRTSKAYVFATKDEARNAARLAAHHVAERLAFTRVA